MASILVVGATGFIGSAIARSLATSEHQLRLAARDLHYGHRLLPHGDWIHADLNKLTSPNQWRALLTGVDFVINASGLLQSGGGDDVHRIQSHAITAMAAACADAGIHRIVQISAAGIAGNDSDFMTSKAVADDALLAGRVPVIILRPGLVIGRDAYGGTQLIRMAAALPFGLYPPFGNTIQTIALSDVVAAVGQALASDARPSGAIDLVAEPALTLRQIIVAHRCWLARPAWQTELTVPVRVMDMMTRVSDGLGRLGWRSPLRRNAVIALANGVSGDAAATRNWLGREPLSLDAALAAMPSGKQDRFTAIAYALLTPAIAALVVMWLLSGLATLLDIGRAAAIITQAGVAADVARTLTVAGAGADIALAFLLLVRRWSQYALVGMLALATLYLILGTILLPALWLDPLAPYAKVLPTMVLAMIVHPLLDRR